MTTFKFSSVYSTLIKDVSEPTDSLKSGDFIYTYGCKESEFDQIIGSSNVSKFKYNLTMTNMFNGFNPGSLYYNHEDVDDYRNTSIKTMLKPDDYNLRSIPFWKATPFMLYLPESPSEELNNTVMDQRQVKGDIIFPESTFLWPIKTFGFGFGVFNYNIKATNDRFSGTGTGYCRYNNIRYAFDDKPNEFLSRYHPNNTNHKEYITRVLSLGIDYVKDIKNESINYKKIPVDYHWAISAISLYDRDVAEYLSHPGDEYIQLNKNGISSIRSSAEKFEKVLSHGIRELEKK